MFVMAVGVGNIAGGSMQILKFCRRIVTNTKNKTNEKATNTDLTRFGNCVRPRDRKGDRSYSNQSIQFTINGDNTALCIDRESTKKREQKL